MRQCEATVTLIGADRRSSVGPEPVVTWDDSLGAVVSLVTECRREPAALCRHARLWSCVKEDGMTSCEVGVGLVGSGFIGQAHAEAFSSSALASVRAVASRSPDRSAEFAARWGIPAWHTDYRELARRPDVDLVSVAAPNWLHRDIVVAAAEAGKHVVCEKPLARTLREADEMIAACRRAGVKLMYAEEICFAPKYVRAKELADEGALGEVYLVRQTEQHYGPHSDWFWDPEQSGGGVLMDMGCHGIEFARWVLGKPAARTVAADAGGGPRDRDDPL